MIIYIATLHPDIHKTMKSTFQLVLIISSITSVVASWRTNRQAFDFTSKHIFSAVNFPV